MRIVLVNVPHPAIGSRIPREQLPPLGLLCVGGPLIDDGHEVSLIDGELGPMPLVDLVAEVVRRGADAVLFGHSGSSSAQPIIMRAAAMVACAMPGVRIVYGSVHPTYFWREILRDEPQVGAIVRGEGEETSRRLMRALEHDRPLGEVAGVAFRQDGAAVATPPAPVITDLDAYRIGWELIDHAHYGYWGGKRALVVQFSRGSARICATSAASAASGRAGGIAIRCAWRRRSPAFIASTASRSSTSPTRTRAPAVGRGGPSLRR